MVSTNRRQAQAIIVMGVAGAGKTTIGRALAEALGWPFYDGDDFHPPENVAKMSAGQPLTDADRWPWLDTLHDLMVVHLSRQQSLVLACSALKKAYRDSLRGESGRHDGAVCFVYLRGDYNLIAGRMAKRPDHFMPEELLRSQFADLEEPEEAIVVDVDRPVADIVEDILEQMYRI